MYKCSQSKLPPDPPATYFASHVITMRVFPPGGMSPPGSSSVACFLGAALSLSPFSPLQVQSSGRWNLNQMRPRGRLLLTAGARGNEPSPTDRHAHSQSTRQRRTADSLSRVQNYSREPARLKHFWDLSSYFCSSPQPQNIREEPRTKKLAV